MVITAETLRQRWSVSVRDDWVQETLRSLHSKGPGFSGLSEQQQAEQLFGKFLFADLNIVGAQALPPNVKALHKQVLSGKYVLQVDEVLNAAAPARDRYQPSTGSNRCLKLLLTDGCQQIVGIEYASLPKLAFDQPAGFKLVINNVQVRRGLLLLHPENCAVLGGQVKRLEEARQKAMACWNAPVVGRPAGSGPRDIYSEARAAAWAAGTAPPTQPQAQPGQQTGPHTNPMPPPVAAAGGQRTGAGGVAYAPLPTSGSGGGAMLPPPPRLPQQQQQQMQPPSAQYHAPLQQGPVQGRMQMPPHAAPHQQQEQRQYQPQQQPWPAPATQQPASVSHQYQPQPHSAAGAGAGAGAPAGPSSSSQAQTQPWPGWQQQPHQQLPPQQQQPASQLMQPQYNNQAQQHQHAPQLQASGGVWPISHPHAQQPMQAHQQAPYAAAVGGTSAGSLVPAPSTATRPTSGTGTGTTAGAAAMYTSALQPPAPASAPATGTAVGTSGFRPAGTLLHDAGNTGLPLAGNGQPTPQAAPGGAHGGALGMPHRPPAPTSMGGPAPQIVQQHPSGWPQQALAAAPAGLRSTGQQQQQLLPQHAPLPALVVAPDEFDFYGMEDDLHLLGGDDAGGDPDQHAAALAGARHPHAHVNGRQVDVVMIDDDDDDANGALALEVPSTSVPASNTVSANIGVGAAGGGVAGPDCMAGHTLASTSCASVAAAGQRTAHHHHHHQRPHHQPQLGVHHPHGAGADAHDDDYDGLDDAPLTAAAQAQAHPRPLAARDANINGAGVAGTTAAAGAVAAGAKGSVRDEFGRRIGKLRLDKSGKIQLAPPPPSTQSSPLPQTASATVAGGGSDGGPPAAEDQPPFSDAVVAANPGPGPGSGPGPGPTGAMLGPEPVPAPVADLNLHQAAGMAPPGASGQPVPGSAPGTAPYAALGAAPAPGPGLVPGAWSQPAVASQQGGSLCTPSNATGAELSVSQPPSGSQHSHQHQHLHQQHLLRQQQQHQHGSQDPPPQPLACAQLPATTTPGMQAGPIVSPPPPMPDPMSAGPGGAAAPSSNPSSTTPAALDAGSGGGAVIEVTGDHAGFMLLCQVPALIGEGAAGFRWPVGVDVAAMFHSVAYDTCQIEDGTALVEACLGNLDVAVEAAGLDPARYAALTASSDEQEAALGQQQHMHVLNFIKNFQGIMTLQYAAPGAVPLIVRLRDGSRAAADLIDREYVSQYGPAE